MPLPPTLYEDDFLIAWDKPSGLSIAPDRGDKSGANLMEEVRARLGRPVANVHRLDAETSGVLLCAKTKPALDYLSGLFQAKRVEKKYLALAVVLPEERAMTASLLERSPTGGLPAEFTIDLPLAPDEGNPGRSRIFRGRGGKPATTEFRVRQSFGKFVWLECRPLTGRTHQIRIHLAAAGAPVLNDRLYGDAEEKLLLSQLKRHYKGRDEERPLIARLALHASELTFLHPETHQPLTIASPLPKEFAVALKYLEKFTPRAPGAPADRRRPS